MARGRTVTAEQTGELAALGTALLWTLSTLAWTSAGKHVGATAVCFVRLLLACVFLSAYGGLVRGRWWPSDASAETWAVLGVSGVAGFFLADLLVFKAFLLIGPRLTLLLQSFTPPLAAQFSWLMLGDRLSAWQWLAMGVTLAGVVWVVLERPNGASAGHDPRRITRGITLAALGAVVAALALVLSKKGLGDYDAAAATFIRVLGGIAGMVPLVTLRRRWTSVIDCVRHSRAVPMIVFGTFAGPFLGVILSMVAVRHCPAGVVSTIIATMPVLILPCVIVLYREKVSLRAAGGAVLSVVGVALLML
jgi:drug/metabolite transporter (DMT)-like permease